MGRVQVVDFVRGTNILFMVMYNYLVSLDFLGIIHIPPSFIYSFVLPWLIAGTFIVLSGISAFLSYRRKRKGFTKRYLIRGLKLLIFAAFITLFTYVFVPKGTIFFGILHFFAFSSFLVPFLIKYKKLNLVAGLIVIFLGLCLQSTTFGFYHLLWLGLIPENFFTLDYFPMIPWLGVLMVGIYLGREIADEISKIKIKSRFAGILTFLGRNSLTIYLIHQPVLILLLIALGFRMF
jgi:uncharacterized membrane protein